MYTCANCGYNWNTRHFAKRFRVSVVNRTRTTDRNIMVTEAKKEYTSDDRWLEVDQDLVESLEEGTHYICKDETSCAHRVFMNQFKEQSNE